MARAIDYLETFAEDQPNLDALANEMGLSPHHAQKVFHRWAGITPKQFVSLLTMQKARPLLREGSSVLDVSYEVGLSGPGRLHDLCIKCEALSPGEIKSGGKGLEIKYGWHPSPFGRAVFFVTARGVAGLAFADTGQEQDVAGDMMARWPDARFQRDDSFTKPIAEQIFSVRKGSLTLLLSGTPFQTAVWRALLEIPEGATTSYQNLASEIGRPKAVRAVGSAVGKNPISYLIPCHRVLRASGALGGYHWGPTRKRAMLAFEQANAEGLLVTAAK